MGTVGLTGQAIGAGDHDEVAALLTRALLIGISAGVALVALQLPLFWAAFQVSPASPEVEALGTDYMRIRIWSAPAAIAMFGITGWLIAQERTGAVLAIQLWMNGLNIGLDYWFVLDLGWGVSGVAFATFLAEWTGLALALWFCRNTFRAPEWRNWVQVFDRPRLRHMLVLNTDILLRSLLLEAVFVSFLFVGAGFGDVKLAANQVLLQFLMITAYALDGFAFAAEALIGQAMGARKRLALRRSAMLTSFWGLICVLLLALVFALFGNAVIDLMTTSVEVRQVAREYLAYMVLAPPSWAGRLDAGRNIHWGDAHPRYAQHDGNQLFGLLCNGLCAGADHWQSRIVDCVTSVVRGAWYNHGPALSGARAIGGVGCVISRTIAQGDAQGKIARF